MSDGEAACGQISDSEGVSPRFLIKVWHQCTCHPADLSEDRLQIAQLMRMRLQEVQQLMLTPHQMLVSVKPAELQTLQLCLATGGAMAALGCIQGLLPPAACKLCPTLQACIVEETPCPQALRCHRGRGLPSSTLQVTSSWRNRRFRSEHTHGPVTFHQAYCTEMLSTHM